MPWWSLYLRKVNDINLQIIDQSPSLLLPSRSHHKEQHIIHINIMRHFDSNNILSDAQDGFRNKRSCETQLIATIREFAKRIAKGPQVDVILLNFAKSFDNVPHSRLIHKLTYYGVNQQTVKWIKSFLQNRQMKVVLECAKSTSAQVILWVPQGSSLGPALFLACINDMPETTTNSETRFFANDTIFSAQSTT